MAAKWISAIIKVYYFHLQPAKMYSQSSKTETLINGFCWIYCEYINKLVI